MVKKKELKKLYSIYFPPNALQGEDIPGHITWKSKLFDLIKIEIPKHIKLKELYNVRQVDYYLDYNKLIIKNCEYGSYIGMLFSSKRAESNQIEEDVVITFLNSSNENSTIIKKIILFRPTLEIIHIPELIRITSNDTSDKVILNNSGKATLLIYIKSDDKSELEIYEPIKIKNIRKSINDKIKSKLNRLKKNYPNYSEFIDEILDFYTTADWKVSKKTEILFKKMIENDVEFLQEVMYLIFTSIIESMEIETTVESFLTYYNSIPKNNILLFNPIDIIDYSSKPAKLSLEILSEDLLRNDFSPESLSLNIVGDKDGYIEIYKLFSFRRE